MCILLQYRTQRKIFKLKCLPTKSNQDISMSTLCKNDINMLHNWISYYILLGVKYFDIYYNGVINNNIIKISNSLPANCRLIQWDYTYWIQRSKGSSSHFAQTQFMVSAIIRSRTQWVGFFDIDEYIVIPKISLKTKVLSTKNMLSLYFSCKWAQSKKDFHTLEELYTSSILVSNSLPYSKRSKHFVNTVLIPLPYIHFMSNNQCKSKNQIINSKLFFLHFYDMNKIHQEKILVAKKRESCMKKNPCYIFFKFPPRLPLV